MINGQHGQPWASVDSLAAHLRLCKSGAPLLFTITNTMARYTPHRLAQLEAQAIKDHAIGLLTSAQLRSILNRLDRISATLGF